MAPLFPGYLFLSFDPDLGRWQSVNSTYGMRYLVSVRGNRPTPVPRNVMDELRRRCPDGEWKIGAGDLRRGDEVRILSGPFAGSAGKFVEMKSNDRVELLLKLLGGETSVVMPSSHMGLNVT